MVLRTRGQLDDDGFTLALVGARAGDDQAFATLWRAFNPPLLRFLSGLTGPDDAADLASTVWLEVVRGLDRFSGDLSGFRAWLFTVGRMRAIDQRRAAGRRPQVVAAIDEGVHAVGSTDGADSVVEERWSTDEAIALLRTLPEDQAEVVLLRVVADLDVATVAEIVGKQPGNVRVLSHRALKQLAGRLERARNAERVPDDEGVR